MEMMINTKDWTGLRREIYRDEGCEIGIYRRRIITGNLYEEDGT